MLWGVEVLASKVRVGMKGGRGWDTASFPHSVCNRVDSFEAEVAQAERLKHRSGTPANGPSQGWLKRLSRNGQSALEGCLEPGESGTPGTADTVIPE